MPRLQTERLLLRPPELGDAAAIARWLGDYEIAKHVATIPFPITTRDAELLVKKAIEDQAKGEAYSFVILRKDSGRLLGFCSLTLRNGSFALTYWLGQPFWGHGFATEAVKKILSFAFRDLKAMRIEAVWDDDNPAAARLLGKLGFTPGTTFTRTVMARGQSVLCHRIGLDRADFGQKRPDTGRKDRRVLHQPTAADLLSLGA